MEIFYPPSLITELADADLFFDTNTFIGAISLPETFRGLYNDLRGAGCSFITIPSVVFEFTRGTNSLSGFGDRSEFVDGFVDAVYPIEKHIDDFRELTVVLQQVKGDIHYTDFLLIACLYKFAGSFLISSNRKDCPLDILDRKFVITIDANKEIRTYGVYQLSLAKFNKAAERILKE